WLGDGAHARQDGPACSRQPPRLVRRQAAADTGTGDPVAGNQAGVITISYTFVSFATRASGNIGSYHSASAPQRSEAGKRSINTVSTCTFRHDETAFAMLPC